MSRGPAVSVLVAARTADEGLDETLTSLAGQGRGSDLEVLLIDTSSAGMHSVREPSGLRALRRLHLPGADLPEAKAAGVRAADGELVAILDPADSADPDWVDEILAAARDETMVGVGGAVLYEGSGTTWDVGLYLFEYGAFAPPLASGPTDGDLPGNNVAYRRHRLLDDCAEVLEREGFFKPLCHHRLRQRGGTLVLRESMRVRHRTRRTAADAASKRWSWGRRFADRRLAATVGGRRWLYRLGVPLVPALLIARHFRRALERPALRPLASRGAIGLLVVCLAWGLGECAGTWLGSGNWRKASW